MSPSPLDIQINLGQIDHVGQQYLRSLNETNIEQSEFINNLQAKAELHNSGLTDVEETTKDDEQVKFKKDKEEAEKHFQNKQKEEREKQKIEEKKEKERKVEPYKGNLIDVWE